MEGFGDYESDKAPMFVQATQPLRLFSSRLGKLSLTRTMKTNQPQSARWRRNRPCPRLQQHQRNPPQRRKSFYRLRWMR